MGRVESVLPSAPGGARCGAGVRTSHFVFWHHTLWVRATAPTARTPCAVGVKYNDLSREELIRLLEARDRRDATRFGLVWEANEIERDKALNSNFRSEEQTS